MRIGLISILLGVLQLASAARQLKADSLVACEDTTGVTVKDFSLLYDHQSHTMYYNASVNLALEGYVYADIDVYIYGLKAISTRLNPCEAGSALRELCPVTSGRIDIESKSELGEDIASQIPGVAFTVPDIDAFAVFKVRNISTAEELSCLYVEIQNTKSVEQTAVKWVTAVLSGLGLLISAVMIFLGTSIDSQNVSAVTVMMLSYFQSMVFLDMEAVQRVPPIASAWCNNIAWSMGVVYARFLESIYRWYVASTGGSPTAYHQYSVNMVLVQKLRKRGEEFLGKVSGRSIEYLQSLSHGWFTPEGEKSHIGRAASLSQQISEAAYWKHADEMAENLQPVHELSKRVSAPRNFPTTFSSTDYLKVYRGIERLAYKSGLEVTSVVMVTYTIFIFVCVCVVFVYACLWLLMWAITRQERRQEKLEMPEKEEEAYANTSMQAMPDQSSVHNSTYDESMRGSMDGLRDPGMRDQEAGPDNVSTTFTAFEGSHKSRIVFLFNLLPALLKGTLLKLWFVALPAIMVFSMWEWTHVDSPAVVVVSVFMLIVCLALLAVNAVKVFFIARRSQQELGTPAYLLYSNPKTLQKYGYLYTMFDARYYWFGAVYVAYNIVKALFIAFSQKSGKTQALALFIIELAMCIAVGVLKPFLSKAVNGIQITAHVVITINACFFLFFSNLMTQNLIISGVMGVIFFILNAAFSTVLLLYIIIYSCLCAFWHAKGTTKREHVAKDERNSFILDNNGQVAEDADELHALGHAAEADHEGGVDPHDAEWFNHENTNPFDADTRTNTMDSAYSSNNGVFHDPGHSAHESQASFGIDEPWKKR